MAEMVRQNLPFRSEYLNRIVEYFSSHEILFKIAFCLSLLTTAFLGWQDLLVLLGMTAVVKGITRRVLSVFTLLLFSVSFAPYSWPTWWFCVAPMVWLWRDRESKLSTSRIIAESMAIGFAMAWMSTGFVQAGLPAWQGLIQAAGCLVFSLQVIILAISIRLSSKLPVIISALICSLVAVGGELLEAWLGVSWSVTNLALAVGTTPLAQWSYWITPFGVSGLLYFINFSLACENATKFRKQWVGPVVGLSIAAVAWWSGNLIAKSVPVAPMQFSALLVQPNIKEANDEHWRPWLELDRITQAALSQGESTDLIVWPELSLSLSSTSGQPFKSPRIATQLTVQDFANLLTPIYKTNSLVGVSISEANKTERHGLEVTEICRYNCGCLVSDSGEISRHEKIELVPFKETLPWLFDRAWLRSQLLPVFKNEQQLTPGRAFKLLSFNDQQGTKRSVAVSVCYESFFPWLPQYHAADTADAIVHLIYDGNTAAHPAMIERHLIACQYRAIETREWNLVCSTWTGSAIIDPTGKIVSQLPAIAGVLNSDSIDINGS